MNFAQRRKLRVRKLIIKIMYCEQFLDVSRLTNERRTNIDQIGKEISNDEKINKKNKH